MTQAAKQVPQKSKLATVLQTPVWGKVGWKQQLAESRLPGHITSVVQSILTACRLSRSEKAAVAEELLAHFRDGMDRGQSSSELVEDFGDPAVAAPLIQSSKRRNRPMWKKSLQFSGYGIAGLAAAYVVVSIWFHMGKPTPSVDYVAQMNQPIVAIPDSEKGWPIYRPMWIKYKFSEGGQFDIPEMWFHEIDPEDEHLTSQRMIRQGDEGWEAARIAFREHADLLDAFRRGAQKPYFGIELQNDPNQYSDEDLEAIFPGRTREDSNDPSAGIINGQSGTDQLIGESLIMVLLPHVQVMRKAARIFVVDTRLAVDENDSERAVQNIETMLGLARHSAEGPVLICSLVGYAIAGITFNQIEEVLQQDPDFFNEDQLARLQKAVQSADIQGWLHFEGELMAVEDIIQRTYTDDGNGDGRLTSQGIKFLMSPDMLGLYDRPMTGNSRLQQWTETVLGPASLFVAASRKEVSDRANRLMDRVIEDADRPFWEAKHFDLDAELEQGEIKYALLSMMLPASQQVRAAMDRALGHQEGVRGAIALYRYHQKNDKWPKSWNEIPKQMLPTAPIDQLTGKPMRFKIVDDQPLIYSVGNDRDDDGGKNWVQKSGNLDVGRHPIGPGFTPSPTPNGKTADGDWIVWPREQRN